MTLTVTHPFVSSVPDGTDPTIIKPSNWNDTHTVTGTANKIFGTDGAGAGTEISAGTNIAISGSAVGITGQIPLANGGTAANLTDPNADRIMFWDDSAGQMTWLTAGTNLTITGTTIDASGGGGTPGGSDTQIQYNSSSSFAGSSKFVIDATNGVMTAGALSGGAYSGGFGAQKNGFANGSTNFGLFDDSSALNTGFFVDSGANIHFLTNSSPRFALKNGTGWIGLTDMLYGFGADFTAADIALTRNAAGIFGITNGSTGGGALNLIEMTAPSAPAANSVVLYAEDNGGGKTRLMARFPTGSAVQIAIEP